MEVGQWTFNPAFVPTAAVAAQAQAWAPHPMWGAAAMHAAAQAAQAQQASDFNPYKRHPVPPSAEYNATKLIENPLGLENMIPRSELEKDPSLTLPPTTPWLWTPKELSEDDGRSKNDTRGTRDSRDRREDRERTSSSHVSSASASARHPQYQPSTPQPQQSSSSQQPLRRSSTMQSSQYSSDPNSHRSHERTNYHARSSDPRTPPASAPVTTSSFSSQYQQQQQSQSSRTPAHSRSHSQHRSHSREPSSQRSSQYEQAQRSDSKQQQSYRQQSEPPVIPGQTPRTPAHVSSASAQARDSEQKRSEAFSSHETLRPTFSPSIVRTPGHYTGTPTPGGSANGTPSRRSATDDMRDDRDPTRRLAREDSISRSSPARRDSTRRIGRDDSRTQYRDREYERPRDDHSDDESPVRPHFRGPIYGPPTPTPGAQSRNSTNGTSRSNSSPTSTGRMPSLTTSMSTLSVDTAPNSASSNGSNGFLGLTGFSDEPEGMLSPLIVGGSVPSAKSSPRDLGRSQTYPSIPSQSQSGNFASIPEETSPPPPLSRTSSKTPRPSPSQPSPKHIRSPSSVGRSRTYPSLGRDPLDGEPL
ncbi:hypothetical protein BC629DRAFT_256375 [Irpex lacteus]|nr:hypothetical protein BC629DRAFT_256375 [Irpex lacteus]